MNKVLTTGAALLASASIASAGGFDRSGQSVGVLFEQGDVVELSFGHVSPSVTGTLGAGDSGNIAPSYTQLGAGLKRDVNDQLSFALIMDQPFGASVDYNNSTGYPAALATAAASVDSSSITGLVRYRVNENLAFHGGLRYVTLEGSIKNIGGAVTTDYEADSDVGFVLGASYEIPSIAMRVALTYSSETDHGMRRSVGGQIVNVTLPTSINLDFQTGIAKDTLLFGSIRWAEWTTTTLVDPVAGALVSHSNDPITYTLGVGRRFSDTWSGAVTLGHEKRQGGRSTDLAPTDGNNSIGLGLTYTMDNIRVTGGVRYVKIGDAITKNNAVFNDNSATAIGLKISYNF